MDSVTTSNGLPGLAMTSGVEDYVLIHVQGFVGKWTANSWAMVEVESWKSDGAKAAGKLLKIRP